MTSRPNILLIVFDTARRDAFEPHGAPAGASPALADLARRGQVHDQVYAPACWTVPSHASLFTGRLPRAAGVASSGGAVPADFRAALEASEPRLLPTVLRAAGYATAGVSANAWVHKRSGFDLGFERWRSIPPHRHNGLTATHWRGRAGWYLAALRAHADGGAALVEAELDAWLTARDGRPFFWFVNLVECHSPYLPPRPFTPFGPVARLRSAHDARRHQTLEGFWRASLAGFDGTDGAIHRMRVQYAAAIRLLDAWLARVLERLDRHGLLDETQVIVTSDHGENLGEAGLLGHAFSLDDRLLRVPWISAGPAPLSLPDRAGLQHVPAALAAAVGLTDHPWEPGAPQEHVAVAQFDAPGRRGEPRTEEAIRSWSLDQRATERLCRSLSAATDGRWKLLRWTDGREQLVDLVADPHEERPKPPDDPAARVQPAALRALRAALDEADAQDRPRIAAARDQNADGAELGDLEAQLRLLGYL